MICWKKPTAADSLYLSSCQKAKRGFAEFALEPTGKAGYSTFVLFAAKPGEPAVVEGSVEVGQWLISDIQFTISDVKAQHPVLHVSFQ
ncbi:MAG: hypothetical protein IPL65_01100 [Lewinellaceae bacterium]|nr:hypothetical protein [Lewinellaceae bacterium]